MSNTPSRGSNPDDESWGKIASDLFGIQFSDGDDFELPDDDAPKKVPPTISANVESASVEASEPSLTEPDEPVEDVSPAKTTVSGNEDHDEFWDILESWNWDESSKQAPPARRTEEPRSSRPRHEQGSSEGRRSRRDESQRRDEPPRREERRSESGDRPRRRDAEPAREAAGPGEEARPARSSREESRPERTGRTEQPQRSRRPEAERPAPERQQPRPDRSPERQRNRETSASFSSEEFGAGVDDLDETPRSKQAPPPRRREESPAGSRRPPAPRRPQPQDDFDRDLIDDLEEEVSDEDSFVSEEADNGSDSDAGGDEVERPRRRRRRRRGRGRGRSTAEPAASADVEFDEPPETDEFGFDEESSVEVDASEESDEPAEERGPRRSRRRRRRRGRRPEAAAPAEFERDEDQDSRLDGTEDDDVEDGDLMNEDDSDEADDEIVAPISYEGIPTWEEAISYLVIVPPTESRHPRGRGDGHRRDDSRRR